MIQSGPFNSLGRAIVLVIGLVALLAGVAQPSLAQSDYPNKPIRFVIPFPAGGSTDNIARPLQNELLNTAKWNVLIDNKAGAGGNIAAEIVAKAPPDGYTWLMASVGTHGINLPLYTQGGGKLPYDPIKDFTPISLVAELPNVLVLNPEFAAKNNINSVNDLIAYARANPGKVNMASSGNGTSIHLAGELFKQQAGVDAQHIPYKGSAPALMGLMRGDVQILIANMPSLKPAIDNKQIKPIALTSLERSPQFPDYSTANESGLPGFEVIVWYGIFAPAGTPEQIVNKLNAELRKITAMADVRKKLNDQGADPINSTPREFAQRIQKDYEIWKKVVDSSGAKAD